MINIVMTLDVCAFLYSLLLLVVYFSKKRIKSFETSIFSILIFVAISSIIAEFFQLFLSVINFEKYFLLIDRIAAVYVFSYFIMTLFLSSYVILKVYMCKEKDGNKILKLKNTLLIISSLISIVMLIISMFCDNATIHFDGDSYYGSGISVTFMVVDYIILVLAIDYAFIFNRKYNTRKDKLFYIMIILLLITSGLFRMIIPSLMVNNMINVFIVAIMFFTIENPDLKLITDLKNANDVKDKFLSSMSHEMKTPLNAILGLSSINDGDDWKDVNKEANVLLDIVNNVIDSNRFNADNIKNYKSEFNILNSVSSIINETKLSLEGKDIAFNYNVPDMVINANSEAIIGIIDRILSNSVKYTNNGFINLNITVNNNILNINLKDSGIGMSEDTLKNIYNKFEREKQNMDGTIPGLGLGLSLVKDTVDALDGTILITSKLNEGTTVDINIKL